MRVLLYPAVKSLFRSRFTEEGCRYGGERIRCMYVCGGPNDCCTKSSGAVNATIPGGPLSQRIVSALTGNFGGISFTFRTTLVRLDCIYIQMCIVRMLWCACICECFRLSLIFSNFKNQIQ